jgi:peroxiredoxin
MKEMGHLQKLHQTYASKGVAVVCVMGNDVNTAKAYAQRTKLTYTILADPNMKAYNLYGLSGHPATVIIDRNGVVQYTKVGYSPGMENDLADRVKALLK